MVITVSWLPYMIIVCMVGVAIVGYGVRQLRRLPAEARRHLGRMLMRPRFTVPVSVAVLAGSRLLSLAALRRSSGRR
jgi:hypothetical protein